jgi:Flp pilus assembly protein TadG
MPRASSRRRGDAGATSVEFALVAVAFLTLLIGTMDLGRYYLIEHSLHSVVSEAARAALVDTTLFGCDTAKARVIAITPALDPKLLELCVTQNPNTGVNVVTVTASYSFSAISPMLASLNGTMSEAMQLSY